MSVVASSEYSEPQPQPNLEVHLTVTHAALIACFDKEIDDFPTHVCCCCERLHQRKSVSVVKLSDDFNSDVWAELKCHIMKSNPDAGDQVLYMCNYCKPMMPPRCVLNGLQTVPIPRELAVLDQLSRQLIQLIRPGTYTGKVPVYNSLKACKETMFFLPLPLNKTLETIQEASESQNKALPNPELYIINPRRACAARVTVVVSVCLCVCYSQSHLSNVLSSHKRYDLLNGQRRSEISNSFL